MKLIKIVFLLFLLIFTFSVSVRADSDHLLISEVQVSGVSGNDEFIELYNPTPTDIDLAGWYITKKPASSSETNLIGTGLTKTIPSHGYFLLANSSGIYAGISDLTYSTGFTLDSTITLYSDNKITKVDQVGYGNATVFESSPATNPLPGTSLERISKIDTDNNSLDFFINDNPAPHNSTYIEQTSSPSPTESPTPAPTPTESPTPTPTPTLSPTPSLTPTTLPTESPTPSPTPAEIPTESPASTLKPNPPGWRKSPVFTCQNSHIPPFVYLLIKFLMPWKFNCS